MAKEIINLESKTVIVRAAKKFDLPEQPIDSADSRPMTFMSTPIEPLSASMDENKQIGQNILIEALMASVIPPASWRLGLDINLSDLAALGYIAGTSQAIGTQIFTDFNVDASGPWPTPGSGPMPLTEAATDKENLIFLMDLIYLKPHQKSPNHRNFEWLKTISA